MLGGKLGEGGALSSNFYGIMGGAYYNGHRWFDMLNTGTFLHGKLARLRGDVVLTKPFLLVAGGLVSLNFFFRLLEQVGISCLRVTV
jgi:hypothetical protein